MEAQTPRVHIPDQESGAVPPKNRPAINIYPEPGEMYDAETGKLNKSHASELLSILDQDGQKMRSVDDPHIDDWLKKASERFNDAIKAFQQKGREESDAIERSLNDQFEDAVGEIRAIIAARTEDTIDITDPSIDVDTLHSHRPSTIDNDDTLDLRPVMQKTIDQKK